MSKDQKTATKTKTKPEILNPRYAGATPELVARALLRHVPEAGDAEADSDPSAATDEPEVRSSI